MHNFESEELSHKIITTETEPDLKESNSETKPVSDQEDDTIYIDKKQLSLSKDFLLSISCAFVADQVINKNKEIAELIPDVDFNDNLKSDLLIDDDNDEDSNEDIRLTADVSQDSMTSDHKWC